jgi:site-specific DNA recombinase
LLGLRLVDEIDAGTFTGKNTELKDRINRLRIEIDACDRGRDEVTELAVKAFELSQRLRERWLTADFHVKRQILELLCLNCSLQDATLCVTLRKPFDVLAEGVEEKMDRGGGI